MHTLARGLVLGMLMCGGAAAQAQAPAGDCHQHIFSARDIAFAGP